MNKIKQHIPNTISGVEPVEATFETLRDLIKLPFVKRFTEWDGFDHYSQSGPSEDYGGKTLLIAEYYVPRKWWVVGYMDERVDDLPDAKYKE